MAENESLGDFVCISVSNLIGMIRYITESSKNTFVLLSVTLLIMNLYNRQINTIQRKQ